MGSYKTNTTPAVGELTCEMEARSCQDSGSREHITESLLRQAEQMWRRNQDLLKPRLPFVGIAVLLNSYHNCVTTELTQQWFIKMKQILQQAVHSYRVNIDSRDNNFSY